jgi:hypothetical protein
MVLAVRLEGSVIPGQVATRLQAERERIATEEARKARIALAVDLQQKAKEVADLQEVFLAVIWWVSVSFLQSSTDAIRL